MPKSSKPFSTEGVYTILHTDELDDFYRSGRTGTFTEGKKWVRAKELLRIAHEEGEVVPLIFAPFAWELSYFAELDDVGIKQGKDGKWSTTVMFSNLERIPPKPKLLKTSLTVSSTGKKIPETHIRPYVLICTPRWILSKSSNGAGRK